MSTIFLLLCALSLTAASPLHDDHDNTARRSLPSQWHQPRDHPVNALFARNTAALAARAPPTVGSPEWVAQYPDEYGRPNYGAVPQAWLDAYNAAKAAGSIPAIPPTTLVPNQNPVYAAGFDGQSSAVCSSTPKCRAPDDVWDAPDGVIGISFDDGPTPVSPQLYGFLQQHQQPATHFMIGRNIVQRPQIFLEAFNNGDDIAVHTWSHPYMTTLNDTGVLAELGWTMQVISDSTGGRVPRYWRPPYGDADNRVRAIAKHVFGLTTVIWNQDTEDWSISSGGTTVAAASSSVHKWLSGAKHPGLIILEHELDNNTLAVFMNAVYPQISQFNWTPRQLSAMLSQSAYQNANGNTGDVTPMSVAGGTAAPTSSSSSTSSASTTAGTSHSGSGTSSSSGTTSTTPSATPTGAAKQRVDLVGTTVWAMVLSVAVALLVAST